MIHQQLIKIFFLSLLVVLAGCTSEINYDSHPDVEALRALKSKPVLILQFDYRDDLLVYGESLEGLLADKVVSQQKASFIDQFRTFFELKDVSQEVAKRYGRSADFGNHAFLRRVLQEFGGEGGFVVTTAYAFEMASGSVKDLLQEEALKKVLPKKIVGPLQGPSQVQSYDFASKTILVNRDGRAVWSFYGKASTVPTFSSMFTPKEFMRSVAGLDPSAQNLLLKMVQLSDTYNYYLSWMMQQDINGVLAKNYFRDFPSDHKNEYVSIFPAENRAYKPFVKDYNPLE